MSQGPFNTNPFDTGPFNAGEDGDVSGSGALTEAADGLSATGETDVFITSLQILNERGFMPFVANEAEV